MDERAYAVVLLLWPLMTVLMAGCAGMSTARVTDGSAPQGRWRIVYDAAGDEAPAIVFVHGWGSDRSAWTDVMTWVADERRVIAIDLIGHGGSDAPEIEYTMDQMSESIRAVMDEQRIDRAVLVGHSNGVPVIRQFYRNHPERVAGMVAVDGALKQVMPPTTAEQWIAPMRRPEYKAFLEQLLSSMPSHGLTDEQLEHMREVMMQTPQHVLIRSIEAAQDPAIWMDDTIDVPLLVVNAVSPFWPDSYRSAVEAMAPDLWYEQWDGVSHLLFMERPEAFSVLLERFVDHVVKVERARAS